MRSLPPLSCGALATLEPPNTAITLCKAIVLLRPLPLECLDLDVTIKQTSKFGITSELVSSPDIHESTKAHNLNDHAFQQLSHHGFRPIPSTIFALSVMGPDVCLAFSFITRLNPAPSAIQSSVTASFSPNPMNYSNESLGTLQYASKPKWHGKETKLPPSSYENGSRKSSSFRKTRIASEDCIT